MPRNYTLRIVAVLFILLGPGLAAVRADALSADSTGSESARYVVRLPRVHHNFANSRDTVPVTLTATDGDLAGFDLKIASDAPEITISDILPGNLTDSCGWEYFAARDLSPTISDEAIRSLWKIVGLAKSSADTSRPVCGEVEGEVTVAWLVIDYIRSGPGQDTLAALFFYWEDCRDNSMAGRDGVRMAISNQVHDYLQRPQSRSPGAFPSRTGAPSQCVKLSAPNHPRRSVDFHNGGINLLRPEPQPATTDSGSLAE